MAVSATQAQLGIDFGTSNTVAMLALPGRVPTPLLFDGSPVLPSAVFASEGRLLVGRDAERAAMSDPASFEPYPKRCIADGSVMLGANEYPVVEVIAAVLRRVADEARRVVGFIPPGLALTHPAGWGSERLRVLAAAAHAAGLPQPRLVPEPVAAATHFSAHLGHRIADGAHVVVYDMGAGTFDVSAVRAEAGRIVVAATGGLSDVGGIDIDFAVVRHLEQTYPGDADQWQRLRTPAQAADRRHRRGLWRDVRDAKEILSRESSAALFIPVLDVDAFLTRDELENLARPLLEQTVALTLGVLAKADIGMESVAGLFLVGGASRMPLSSTMLLRQTRKAPTVLEQPELVVAAGAIDAPGSPVPVADPRPPVVVNPPSVSMVVSEHTVVGEAVGPATGFHAGIAGPATGFQGEAHVPVHSEAAGPPTVFHGEAHVPHLVFRGVAKVPDRHSVVVTDAGVPAVPAAEPLSNPPPPAPMTTLPEPPPAEVAGITGEPITAVALSGTILAVASGRSAVLCDLDAARKLSMRDGNDMPLAALAWSPETEGRLATADGALVKLWQVRRSEPVGFDADTPQRTVSCPGPVRLMSWTGGVLAVGNTSEVLVWDTETGECTRTWRFSGGPQVISELRALAWSPDGNRLAAGGSHGDIKIWEHDADNASLAFTLAPIGVRTLAWSPGGEWLVIGDAAGAIRIWRMADRSQQAIVHAHDAAVQTVAWSPDGKLLASGSIDQTIKIWDAGSGREHSVLRGHTAMVTSLCWTSDSQRLVSGGMDGTVRLWDLSTGQQLYRLPDTAGES